MTCFSRGAARPFLILTFLLATLAASCASEATADDATTPTYRRLSDLTEAYDKNMIRKTTNVDLEATLTCWDREWGIVFVQEDSIATFVDLKWSEAPLQRPVIGSRVRVQGQAKPGDFTISQATLTVLGTGTMPQPKPISLMKITAWENSSRYVQTTGVVEQAMVFPQLDSCFLTVREEQVRFLVRVVGALPNDELQKLLKAKIVTRGVLAVETDQFRRPEYRVVHAMSPDEIEIQTPAPDTGREPPSPLRSIRDIYTPPMRTGRRVLFHGQVGFGGRGDFVSIEDDDGSIRVPMLATRQLLAGVLVDIQGRVKGEGDSLHVEAEVIRVAQSAKLRPPVRRTVEALLRSRIGSQRVAVQGRFQRVVEHHSNVHELHLTSDGVSFRVHAPATRAEIDKLRLTDGDTLECAGLVRFDDVEGESQFTLHSDMGGIAVVQRFVKSNSPSLPPWLAAGGGFILLGLLLFFTLHARANRRKQPASEVDEQLGSALNAIRDGILIFDSAGRLTSCNRRINDSFPATCRVGDDASSTFERIGQALGSDLVFESAWRKVSEDPLSTTTVELQVRTPSGMHLEVISSPILSENESVIGRIWRFDDVTDRHDLESRLVQSQKMEAVGRLAGGVAHDFNNLLMGITTNLELCRQQANASGLAHLEAAEEAAGRAADLVSHLLSFSRSAPLQRRPHSLNSIVRRVVDLLQRTLDTTIALEVELDEELGGCEIDATQIEQVLVNLCINARDALPAEDGCIRVITRNDDQSSPPDSVELIVEDNGHGMSREVMAKVFEPFYTTKSPGKGTGLGLAMSYGIINQHGGRIICSSMVGQGSSFRVSLPRTSSAIVEEVAVGKKPKNSVARGSGHVLLADDEEVVRCGVESLLISYGYQVTAVANGQDAVDAIFRDPSFDLAILDLTMPVLSGRQAFEIIAERFPALPVVICSGHICGVHEFRTSSGRMPDAVLTKPCEPTRFLAVLQKLVREHVER